MILNIFMLGDILAASTFFLFKQNIKTRLNKIIIINDTTVHAPVVHIFVFSTRIFLIIRNKYTTKESTNTAEKGQQYGINIFF